MNLRLDWIANRDAQRAVERWHYSRRMPAGKVNCLGVWEDGRFVGAVVFGLGSGHSTDGRRYGLRQSFDVAELLRVALRDHRIEVSRIISIAVRLVRRANPGLKLLLSFADPAHGHHGGIYQAAGWLYTGVSAPTSWYRDYRGQVLHQRNVTKTGMTSRFGKRAPCVRRRDVVLERHPGKHRYMLPLDDDVRNRIIPLVVPYPKRVRGETIDTPGDQPGEGGVTPTRTLQSKVLNAR